MKFKMVTAYRASGGNDIELWGRSEKGDKVCFPISDFQPYFYAKVDDFIPPNSAIVEQELGFEGIFGEDLKKIVTKTPQDVAVLRELFKGGSWEADILFPRRWLINQGITNGFSDALESVEIGDVPLVKSYLDIEVKAEEKMPNSMRDPVTCFCLSDGSGYVSGILADFNYMDENENWVVFYCSTERELLRKLLHLIDVTNPDLIAGWNVNFDLEYLTTRCIVNSLKMDIRSSCVADMLAMYKKLYRHKRYRLKDIALDEKLTDTLEEKVNYAKLWREDKKGLLNRNKRHTQWCVELDKKLDITEYYWQLKALAGLENLEDTLYATTILDTILLRRSPWILPTRSKHVHKKYEGAYVMNAPTGIFEGVCIYDVSAFYPNIVMNEMLDPKILFEYTKLHEGEIKWKGYREFAVKYLEDGKATITLGLIGELIKLRKELQDKPQNKTKLVAIKAFLNATCFTPDTNILTPTGVRNITEMKIGDKVYNVDKKSHAVRIDIVVDTQCYDYNDNTFTFFRGDNDIVSVTKEHKFLVGSKSRFKTAEELYNTPPDKNFVPSVNNLSLERYNEIRIFSLFDTIVNNRGTIWIRPPLNNAYKDREYPLAKKYIKSVNGRIFDNEKYYDWRIVDASNTNELFLKRLWKKGWTVCGQISKKTKLTPIFFDKKDFMEFMGWFISEGSLRNKPELVSTRESNQITLSQKTNSYRDEIMNLCSRMNLDPSSDWKGVTIVSEPLRLYLYRLFPENISKNKYIPEFIFNEGLQYQNALLNTLYKGDGSKEKSILYTTNSDKLKEGVIRLALLQGNNYIRTRYDGCHRIHWSNHRRSISKDNLRKEHYQGKVYCVTTNNGTVFAGKNGNFIVTGQSYGSLAYKNFRIYEPRIPERIAEVARNVIQEVGKYVGTLGYKVVGSDTDSCMVQVPENKHKQLEEQINVFLSKFGDYKVKVEHYFDRMIWVGAKKRYAGKGSDGRIHTTGFDLVRSDSSEYTKEIQEKVLEMLLDGKAIEVADYIRKMVAGVKDCSISDIAITKSLGRDLSEYKVENKYIKAIKANTAMRLSMTTGEAFSIVPAKNYPFGVCVFTDIGDVKTPIVLDIDEIVRTQVKLKTEDLLGVIGISWSEIEGQGRLL